MNLIKITKKTYKIYVQKIMKYPGFVEVMFFKRELIN